jgi:hypothetical protein
MIWRRARKHTDSRLAKKCFPRRTPTRGAGACEAKSESPEQPASGFACEEVKHRIRCGLAAEQS